MGKNTKCINCGLILGEIAAELMSCRNRQKSIKNRPKNVPKMVILFTTVALKMHIYAHARCASPKSGAWPSLEDIHTKKKCLNSGIALYFPGIW